MRTVEIIWEGPYDYDTVIKHYDRDDAQRCDFGVYQIYGPHDLYANKKRPEVNNILLYIGMTVSGSKFSGRIATHAFCHGPEFEIYLGRIVGAPYDNDDHEWEAAVKDAEKLLINRYAPPYNGMNTGDLRKDQLNFPELVLVNKGKKMDIDEKIFSKDVVYEID